MSCKSCCLAKQEAAGGRSGKDPPAASLSNQRVEVKVVIKTKQRELEAVLAALFSVTGARVAARPGQDRLDLPLEGNGEVFFTPADLYGDPDLSPTMADDELAFSAAEGSQEPSLFHLQHGRGC